MQKIGLTGWILIAMVTGVAVGWWVHRHAGPARIDDFCGAMSVVTDVFLRLIKMIIAPLVFSTLVAGIAKLGDVRAVGRIGGKTLLWFMGASLLSLLLGLILMNALQLGAALHLPMPAGGVATGSGVSGAGGGGVDPSALSLRGFITHVFPRSIFEAMANNEILQIVIFSVFFGIATASIGEAGKLIVRALDAVAQAILRVTGYVMYLAPVAALAAIASVLALKGPELLVTYGKFILTFYLSIIGLWLLLLLVASVFIGRKGGRSGYCREGHGLAGFQHGEFGSGLSPVDPGTGANFRMFVEDREFLCCRWAIHSTWTGACCTQELCLPLHRAGLWRAADAGSAGVDAAGADADEQRRVWPGSRGRPWW